MLLELITGDQIRAARALLKRSAKDLANQSGVGISTIKRLELMDGVPSAQTRILASIHNTLQTAGIEFIGTPDDAPGPRLSWIDWIPSAQALGATSSGFREYLGRSFYWLKHQTAGD